MAKEASITAPPKVWFNVREAARYCQLDQSTLWRARKRGTLKAGGVGRAVRFRRDELDKWLASGGPDQS